MFTVTFATDSDDFTEAMAWTIAVTLRRVAARIDLDGLTLNVSELIKDGNGNTVGHYTYTRDGS